MTNREMALRANVLAILGCSLAAGLLGPAARAAEQHETAANLGQIEEITVTARRRAESQQSVPLAITALSGSSLAQQQIIDSKGLSFSAPNLLVGQQTANSSAGLIFLRGIGQDDSTPVSEPGVAIYVDDVYMPRTQGALIDILDIDRVEVLRGPQGTLYGRNSTGGAIRYILGKPSLTDSVAKAELTLGSFNRQDVRGTFGAPLIDGKLALKLDVSSREQDGYMTRATTGEKLNSIDRQVARLGLRWMASDTVTVDIATDVSRDRSSIVVGTPMKEGDGPDGRVPQFGGNYISGASAPNLNRFDTYGLSGVVTWDLGATELKSVTSYRHFKQEFWGDLSSGPGTLFDDIHRNLSDSSLTQEFQWTSRSSGPWQWVIGAFYMHEKWHNIDEVLFLHDATQRTDSAALFGEATYQVTDRFNVTLGSRFTYDSKDYAVDAISLFGTPFAAQKSKSWTNYSPKLAFDFKLTPDVLLFTSFRNGYKVGAFQNFPQGVADVTQQYQKPEHVNAYELGFKSDWLDHKLRVNFAGFYSKYRDIQFQVLEGVNFIARNADARIYGTELELTAKPVSGLTLYGFVSSLNTKLTKSGVGLPPVGSRLRFSPKWQSKVGFDYDWSLGSRGKLTAGTNYTWVDKIDYDAFNGAFAVQDAFHLLDAHLGYESPSGKWHVELAGKNLNNTVYSLLIQPYGGEPAADGSPGSSRLFEPPRTWSLTVGTKF